MTTMCRLLLAAAAVFLLLPFSGQGQDTVATGARSSIGFRAGYGIPLGEWAKSRIAPEVQMFSGGVSVEGDISFRLGQKWALAVGGSYTKLSGSNWEEHTKSYGDVVGVNASIATVSISFRPHLMTSSNNLLFFELGVTGIFASGDEVVNGEHYAYDFFSDFRFGGQAALEYDRLVSDDIAFTLRAGAVVGPNAMSYADGESRTIIYVPLMAGIRFLL